MEIMRLQRKNSIKARTIIPIVIALIAIGIVAAYALLSSNKTPANSDNQPGESQTNQGSQKPTGNSSDTKTEPALTDRPAPITTDEQTGKQQLQMTASHDIDSSTIYIRGGVNNLVVYDGVCSATLRGPNQEVLTKPTTLLQNATTTDCKTIQVPLSELSSGKWTYKLTYSSSTLEGESSENVFEIK